MAKFITWAYAQTISNCPKQSHQQPSDSQQGFTIPQSQHPKHYHKATDTQIKQTSEGSSCRRRGLGRIWSLPQALGNMLGNKKEFPANPTTLPTTLQGPWARQAVLHATSTPRQKTPAETLPSVPGRHTKAPRASQNSSPEQPPRLANHPRSEASKSGSVDCPPETRPNTREQKPPGKMQGRNSIAQAPDADGEEPDSCNFSQQTQASPQ